MSRTNNEIIKSYNKGNTEENGAACKMCVFDMESGFEIITSVGFGSPTAISGSVLKLMDQAEGELLTRHMKSYDDTPLLLSTNLGTAILSAALSPSSAIGVLMFICIESESLLKLVSHGIGGKFAVSPSIELRKGRIDKRTKASIDVLVDWRTRLSECFSGLEATLKGDSMEDITDRILARAYSVSELCGCPIEIKCLERVKNNGNFNFGLYAAYLLLVLASAEHSGGEIVSLEIEDRAMEVIISAEFKRRTGYGNREIDLIMSKARKRNMVFEASVSKERSSVAISPINKDWSYLEIKDEKENALDAATLV